MALNREEKSFQAQVGLEVLNETAKMIAESEKRISAKLDEVIKQVKFNHDEAVKVSMIRHSENTQLLKSVAKLHGRSFWKWLIGAESND